MSQNAALAFRAVCDSSPFPPWRGKGRGWGGRARRASRPAGPPPLPTSPPSRGRGQRIDRSPRRAHRSRAFQSGLTAARSPCPLSRFPRGRGRLRAPAPAPEYGRAQPRPCSDRSEAQRLRRVAWSEPHPNQVAPAYHGCAQALIPPPHQAPSSRKRAARSLGMSAPAESSARSGGASSGFR